MAAKKKTNIQKAIEEVAGATNLSYEDVAEALQYAVNKAFVKYLNMGDDALTRIELNYDIDEIEMYLRKEVVEEVEDDFLQIELGDERLEGKNLRLGDFYETRYTMADFSKGNVMSMGSIFQQRVRELEKAALYDTYKHKIGEMITGIVESSDDRGTNVRVGATNQTLYLPARSRIGNESFEVGKPIKVYVVDVENTTKGAQINISRSHEGFLKRVMEQEIAEIYDGTVIIKEIAREAGDRSKVAVYSLDENVDATGACIGPNGTRIQKVVAQLGNNSPAEKIDIVAYSENPGLFIIEALRPAQVIGVKLDHENRKAIAVVNNDGLSVAIGRRGVNVRLAVKLTNWHIDIKELDDAYAEGIQMQSINDLIEEQNALIREKEYEKYLASITPTEKDDIPSDYVAPVSEEVEEEVPVTKEVEVKPVVEPVVEPVVKEEVKQPEVKVTEIKTTKTLEELEAELEKDKQKAAQQDRRPQRKRREETETEEVEVSDTTAASRMDIYTEEELAALEAEQEYEDEYVDDYSEYDDLYDEGTEDWFK